MATRRQDVAKKELIIPGYGPFMIPVEQFADMRRATNIAVQSGLDSLVREVAYRALWLDNVQREYTPEGESYYAADIAPYSGASRPAYDAALDQRAGRTPEITLATYESPVPTVEEQEPPVSSRTAAAEGRPIQEINQDTSKLHQYLMQDQEMDEEKKFRIWYGSWARKLGLNPDPDAEGQFYDYRAAFRAGSEPKPTPGEDSNDPTSWHWPSEHKQEGHPNLIVDGRDTRTGEPVSPSGGRVERTVAHATADAPEGELSLSELMHVTTRSALTQVGAMAPGMQRVSAEGETLSTLLRTNLGIEQAIEAREPPIARTTREGKTEGFLEGMESGMEKYAQIFGVEPDDEQQYWSEGVPTIERAHTARAIGEFAGMTVPFAVGWGAASFGASAVGLGARMTPAALHFTKSGVTGMTMGVLSSSDDATFGEVVFNGAKEAGYWMLGDVALMGLTGHLGRMLTKGGQIKGIRRQIKGGDDYINPVILKVEEALNPNAARDYRAVANRVWGLWKHDPDKPLAGAVAEIASRTEAFGVSLVEGLPESAVVGIGDDVIKALPDGYKHAVYKNGDNSKILIADADAAIGAGSTSQREMTVWHTFESGGEVEAEKLVSLLRRGAADKSGVAPLEVVTLSLPEGAKPVGDYKFTFASNGGAASRKITIAIPHNANASEVLDVLAHEVAHDMVLMKLGDVPRSGLLAQFFGYRNIRGEFVLPGGKKLWLKEMKKVQELYWARELRGRQKAMEFLRSTGRNTDEFEILADYINALVRRGSLAGKVAPQIRQQIFDTIIEESNVLATVLRRENVITQSTLREMLNSTSEKTVALAKEIRTRIKDNRSFLAERDKIVGEQRKLTESALKQFEEEGFFDGMRVFFDGQMFEAVKVSPKNGKLILRSLQTAETPGGRTKVVNISDVQIPTMQGVMKFGDTLKSVVTKIVAQGVPRTLGVFARDSNNRLVRMIFRTRDLQRIKGSRQELRAWVQKHRGAKVLDELTDAQVNQLAGEIAREQGKLGVMLLDDGMVHIIGGDLANRAAIHVHPVSPDEVGRQVPRMIEGQFSLTPVDVAAEALYQSGVPVREVEHLARMAAAGRADELWKLAGADYGKGITTKLWSDVMDAVEFFNTSGARQMVRSGGQVSILADGTRVITVANDRIPGGIVAKVAENEGLARQWVANYSPPGGPNLSDGIPFPEEMGAWVNPTGGTRRPKFGETMEASMTDEVIEHGIDEDQKKFLKIGEENLSERAVNAFQRMFPVLTSSRSTAIQLEKQKLGPVFTEIWQRSQEAIIKVKRAMIEPMAEFEGRTYIQQMNHIRKQMRGLNPERRRVVSEYLMATNREEFMTSARIMGRPFNATEKKLIEFLELLGERTGGGTQFKLPKLLGSIQSARESIRDPLAYLGRLNSELKGLSTSQQRTLTAQRLVERFQGDPSKMTLRDVFEAMGHTDQEINVMSWINEQVFNRNNEVNLFGISRYFNAGPETKAALGKRVQITAKETEIADQILNTLGTAFGSKEDAVRFMEGILPEVKHFVAEGFSIDDKMIKKLFGGHAEFLHKRVIAGEIDVYAKDPVYLTWRIIRGKLMQRFWDPVEEQAIKPAMRTLASNSGGARSVAWKRMDQYLDELRGIPHSSFERLENAFVSMTKTLGIADEIPESMVRDLLQKMNMVVYKATIPMRMQLLVRNFFEVYRAGGVTGGKSLGRAISHVINPRTSKEAFEEAWRAGALKPDLPVYSVDPTARGKFGVGFEGQTRKAVQQTIKRGQQAFSGLDALAEEGMRYYQRIDEYSRAISYHAMKFRMQEAAAKSGGNFERFIALSKINTFEEPERLAFAKLWNQGRQQDAIQYASTVFADKAMFLYGNANHPTGWGSVYGVVFGQFGTWPVQYLDWMMKGLSRGTMRDRAQFAAWNMAAPWALVEAGKDTGIDFNAWWGVSSLRYTGGPYTDIAVDMVKAWSGSDAERAMARANLRRLSPTNEFPSVFIPVSFAIDDYLDIIRGEDPISSLLVKRIPERP